MIKSKLHKDLQDNEILNVDRAISPDAELIYVKSIEKYAYKGDAVCFGAEDIGSYTSDYQSIIDSITDS